MVATLNGFAPTVDRSTYGDTFILSHAVKLPSPPFAGPYAQMEFTYYLPRAAGYWENYPELMRPFRERVAPLNLEGTELAREWEALDARREAKEDVAAEIAAWNTRAEDLDIRQFEFRKDRVFYLAPYLLAGVKLPADWPAPAPDPANPASYLGLEMPEILEARQLFVLETLCNPGFVEEVGRQLKDPLFMARFTTGS